MSIQAFLKPVKAENKKVVISDRFKDENGKPVPFEIRAVTQKENKKLIERYTRKDKQGNETFKRTEYVAALVVEATVFPDLNSKELQDAYGVMGAESLIQEMLLIGEFANLAQEVQNISGLDKDINDDIDEAKN